MSIVSKVLAPGIIVYRSGIEDLDSVIRLVDNSLNNPLPDNKVFTPPKQGGGKDTFISITHVSGPDLNQITEEVSQSFDYDLVIKLQGIFYEVFEDYLVKNKETEMLMPYIDKSKTIKENNDWAIPDMSLIKHGKTTNPDIAKPKKDEPWTFRLGWHTDSLNSSLDSGMKHSVTANLYLNDNYQGGTINFLYGNTINNIYGKDNLNILSYKPLAGDIILYPSMWPIAHSVSYSGIEDRYLISSILRYSYDGSMKDELDKFVIPYETDFFEYAETVKENNMLYIDGKDLWV